MVRVLTALWPRNGQRHAFAKHLGGWFASRSVDQAAAEQIVHDAADAAGDDDPADRVRVVRDTYTAQAEGRPVTGLSSALSIVPAFRGVIDELNAALGIVPAPAQDNPEATAALGAPPRHPVRFRKGEDLDATPITYLVQDLIPTGMLTALGGKDGRGKSLLALEVARCVLTGTPLFGQFPVKQGKVFAVLLDDPEPLIRARLAQMGILDHPNLRIATERDVDMANPQTMLAGLAAQLVAEQPALVIIDALYLFIPSGGTTDQANSAGAMRPVMVALNAISTLTGATTLLIAHDNKAGADIAGSGVVRQMCKAILRVLLPPEAEQAPPDEAQTNERVLQLNKLKTGKPATWRLRLEGPGAWTFLGTARAYRAESIQEAILANLHDVGPATATAIAKGIGKRKTEVMETCRAMALADRLQTTYQPARQQVPAAVIYRLPDKPSVAAQLPDAA
jgi:RecA-family ATPase